MKKVVLLNKQPHGTPKLSDFKITSEEIPTAKDGELLLKTAYVSVDPYLRGRMNEAKSYVPSFELNKPIQSGVIAEVIKSKHADFKKVDFVSGNLDWKEHQTSNGKGLHKVSSSDAKLSSYLWCNILYNETKVPLGPRLQPIILTKSATMRGFIIGDL